MKRECSGDIFRSSYRMCFVKNGVFKNFTNFTGKYLCWSLFLTKLQVFRPATLLLKWDSNIGAFLWQKHLFWRTSANDYFCISEIQTTNNVIYTLAQSFIFNFRGFTKCFLTCSALQTLVPPNLSLLYVFLAYRTFPMFPVLNRLNAFSHYQKFVSIGKTQNLSSGSI